MQIEAWQSLGKLTPPTNLDQVTKLVIRDSFGQPIAVFTQPTPEHVWIAKAGDEDFYKQLKALGITDNVPTVVSSE